MSVRDLNFRTPHFAGWASCSLPGIYFEVFRVAPDMRVGALEWMIVLPSLPRTPYKEEKTGLDLAAYSFMWIRVAGRVGERIELMNTEYKVLESFGHTPDRLFFGEICAMNATSDYFVHH